MKYLFLAILFFLAGCGEESVNQIRPGQNETPYSSSHDSSQSDYVLSSSDFVAASSSNLQITSSAEESSSSAEMESNSSSSSLSKKTIICGEMTDERDGQTYRTVTVEGDITWMAVNLNYAYLQPTADLDSSSWCLAGWKCDWYGRVYLWSAMMDSAAIFSDKTKGCGYYATEEEWQKCSDVKDVRGVCPEGWRLPTIEDFRKLVITVRDPPYFPEYEACDEVLFEYDYAFDEYQLGCGFNKFLAC